MFEYFGWVLPTNSPSSKLELTGGREEEKEAEKHPCERETSLSCLSHTSSRGPGPQPIIKPTTFHFAKRSSTN